MPVGSYSEAWLCWLFSCDSPDDVAYSMVHTAGCSAPGPPDSRLRRSAVVKVVLVDVILSSL